ncbi:hypothetical protein COOONC_08341 [Cooperia oncophora]
MIMQIDPRVGLLVRHPGKTGRPTISIDYDLIDRLVVRRDSEISSLISIRLKSSPDQGLEFLVDKDDIDDLVGYICGYQMIHCNRQLVCDFDETPPSQLQPPTDPPPYSAVHKVIPCGWNYSSDITSSDQSLDLTSEPPPYELANSFAESIDEKRTASPKSDKSRSPPSSRRNSDVSKRLLRATDSLLIKNNQKLQRKENGSPAPRSARLMESVSDSSDADDSSWSSPIRSPFIDNAIRRMMNGPPDTIVYDPGRRESIETLISSVHAQQVPNLETLILFYQDSNGVKSPKITEVKENGASPAIRPPDTIVYDPGRRESIETLISSVHAQQVPNLETLILFYQDSNGVKSPKITEVKENGASPAISQGDERSVVAPMASIEEEMTISQITAAS